MSTSTGPARRARVAPFLAELGSPWPGRSRWVAYGLICLLAVLLALWELFLVPLRAGAVPVPLSLVLAPVTTLVLCLAGAHVLGRWEGAIAPGVLWTAVPVLLVVTGRGDQIASGSLYGALSYLGVLVLGPMGFLYGVLGAPRVISLGSGRDRPAAAASPGGPTSRQPGRGQRREA